MIVDCGFCREGNYGGKPCTTCRATGKIDVVKGTACTFHIGSDSYPCTVVNVTPQTIVTRDDRALRPGVFEPAAKMNGQNDGEKRWRLVRGRWRLRYYTLSIGKREIKLDPSF